MKENSIEEYVKILEEKMNKELDFFIENASKAEQLTAISMIAMKEPIILLFLSILSDYKRVLKENEEKTTILLAGAEKVKQLEKENEELKADNYELNNRITDLLENIPIQKVKDIIDRIDYDIKKTKEIISKNTNIYASYRKNDYQIVRLRAMNTKSLDIKKRLQKLLESEE